MSRADDILDVSGLWKAELKADLLELLTIAEESRPRNLQRALGPSSVGHMCERLLAYGTVASRIELPPGINSKRDRLASIFGTALHTVGEEGAKLKNEMLKARGDKMRWLTEQKVEVRPGLSGTADLYDIANATVIDWKFPGQSAFDKYKRYGPSDTYRAQAHLYGRGYKNLGFPVKRVAIMFCSRAGHSQKTELWGEEYSDEIVDDVLARLDGIEAKIAEYKCEEDAEGFLRIPITASDACTYCPYWSPDPQGPMQCGGKMEKRG